MYKYIKLLVNWILSNKFLNSFSNFCLVSFKVLSNHSNKVSNFNHIFFNLTSCSNSWST